MRTTLNIDDEAMDLIKTYARARRISLGQAASDLVHQGADSLPKLQTKNGWVIFELPPGSPVITNEALDDMEQQDLEEEYRRAVAPRR